MNKAMNHSKKEIGTRITLFLLIVNLLISSGIVCFLIVEHVKSTDTQYCLQGEAMQTGEKYLLYIGLNDKNTYKQEIPTNEARDTVNAICAKHVEGYTGSDANGGWVDQTGTLTQENTLVYAFYDISEDQLTSIMDEVLVALNQNSILVESQQAFYTYYSGR